MNEETVEEKPTTRKKRRTKAEMEEARAKEEAIKAETEAAVAEADALLEDDEPPKKERSTAMNKPADLPKAEAFAHKADKDPNNPKNQPSMSAKTEANKPGVSGNFGSIKTKRKPALNAPTPEMLGLKPVVPAGQQPASATARNRKLEDSLVGKSKLKPSTARALRAPASLPPVTGGPTFGHRAKVMRIVDGDTVVGIIDMGFGFKLTGKDDKGVKIRLHDIQAPDKKEEGFEEATGELKRLLLAPGGRPKVWTAISHAKEPDNWGRYLYEFFDATGKSINQDMVKRGYAKPYRR